jgi:TBC1 domain family member 5
VLEADYSTALQLLLKYSAPKGTHGPHTFVDDAVYLRDHLSPSGASTLIMKYTGKAPESPKVAQTLAAPSHTGLGIRQTSRPQKSPLSPARFMQQQGAVEALFQGAARGVLERSERLGINQAVRDAMMEIRRNVNEARSSMKAGRDIFSEPGPSGTAMKAVAAMDRRNKQLAAMLDDTITTLRALSASNLEDKKQCVESMELAAAKAQFVKVYLEDSTLALPEQADALPNSPSVDSPREQDHSATGTAEPLNDAVAAMVISTPDMAVGSPLPEVINTPQAPSQVPEFQEADQGDQDKMDTDPQEATSEVKPLMETAKTLQRPQAPNPTRSTIAQSSFAWMLEPDESSATKQAPVFPSPQSAREAKTSATHRKRPSANANRERTAFLFGEVPTDKPGQVVLPEDIFGLEPLKNKKAVAKETTTT